MSSPTPPPRRPPVASNDVRVASISLVVVDSLRLKVDVVQRGVEFVLDLESLLARVDAAHDAYGTVTEVVRCLWPMLEHALDDLLTMRRRVLSDMSDAATAEDPVLPGPVVDPFRARIETLEARVSMLQTYAGQVLALAKHRDSIADLKANAVVGGDGGAVEVLDVSELCTGVDHAVEEADAGDASVLRLLHHTDAGGQGPSSAAWEHFAFLIQVGGGWVGVASLTCVQACGEHAGVSMYVCAAAWRACRDLCIAVARLTGTGVVAATA